MGHFKMKYYNYNYEMCAWKLYRNRFIRRNGKLSKRFQRFHNDTVEYRYFLCAE